MSDQLRLTDEALGRLYERAHAAGADQGDPAAAGPVSVPMSAGELMQLVVEVRRLRRPADEIRRMRSLLVSLYSHVGEVEIPQELRDALEREVSAFLAVGDAPAASELEPGPDYRTMLADYLHACHGECIGCGADSSAWNGDEEAVVHEDWCEPAKVLGRKIKGAP
jgi:hypothetical protein